MTKKTLLGCACASLAVLATVALAQQEPPSRPSADARVGDPYLLDICVVSGEKLGSMGNPVVKVYEGREVRFCCNGCVKEFEGDPAKHWKKADELMVQRQRSYYPVEICFVSGEALGSMGEPIDYVHMNRLIRFCCKGCLGEFRDDPESYVKKLDEAVIAKQREHYPLTACPISKQELGSMGDPAEIVYGNRLVRFCCAGCIPGFEKDPTAAVAALDKAWHDQHGIGGKPAGDKGGHDDDHDGGHDHGGHDHDHD